MSDITPNVGPPDVGPPEEALDKAAEVQGHIEDNDVAGHHARNVENGDDDLNPPRR